MDNGGGFTDNGGGYMNNGGGFTDNGGGYVGMNNDGGYMNNGGIGGIDGGVGGNAGYGSYIANGGGSIGGGYPGKKLRGFSSIPPRSVGGVGGTSIAGPTRVGAIGSADRVVGMKRGYTKHSSHITTVVRPIVRPVIRPVVRPVIQRVCIFIDEKALVSCVPI
jgi:hypothetical protein